MDWFIHHLYDPTLQIFIIVGQCQNFNHVCMIIMKFKDLMISLQTPNEVLMNPVEKIS